jgi:hypothetical protein
MFLNKRSIVFVAHEYLLNHVTQFIMLMELNRGLKRDIDKAHCTTDNFRENPPGKCHVTRFSCLWTRTEMPVSDLSGLYVTSCMMSLLKIVVRLIVIEKIRPEKLGDRC